MRTAARTAVLMAVLTLGMKFLGFLREMFLAGFFGTSYITDAYVMGTAIPGTLFAAIFTSVGVAYLPLFSSIVEKDGKEAGMRFTNETVNLMGVVTILLSLCGIFLADVLVGFFASGFQGETAALTAFYLRVAFFYIFFQGTASVMEAYLQYRRVFLPQIAAGYLQGGMVLAAVVISAFTDHIYMAFGLLLGSALRMLVIWQVARRQELVLRPACRFGAAARRILVLAVPVFIGSTVNQVNTFVDKWLASGLPEGSVSALNYGYLLVNLIVSLTVTVIVTIIYPRFAQSAAAGSMESYNDALEKGMNIILITGIPFSLGCMAFSDSAVELVYERGAFDGASTALTSGAFFYYSIGISFIALNALLSKAFYSLQDTRTPVLCGVAGALVNIGLNLLLVGPMAHRGLALASSIAAVVNSLLLYCLLRHTHKELRVLRSRKEGGLIALAALLAVGAARLLHSLLTGGGPGAALENALGSFLHLLFSLGLAALLACLLYLALLKLFRIPELAFLKDVIKTKRKEK
ncbi:MAG: murein biosynthesis integral membrane protein MurJ [Bacillota bacterium]|nr:murein biosynthesis integral membrane protein MurJ [Bacillota bacterium]